MTTHTAIIGSAIESIQRPRTNELSLKEFLLLHIDRAEINARVQDVLSPTEL